MRIICSDNLRTSAYIGLNRKSGVAARRDGNLTTKSKGVRLHRKQKAEEIKGLREIGLSWRKIGIIVGMDRNNARRTYLKEKKNGIR